MMKKGFSYLVTALVSGDKYGTFSSEQIYCGVKFWGWIQIRIFLRIQIQNFPVSSDPDPELAGILGSGSRIRQRCR